MDVEFRPCLLKYLLAFATPYLYHEVNVLHLNIFSIATFWDCFKSLICNREWLEPFNISHLPTNQPHSSSVDQLLHGGRLLRSLRSRMSHECHTSSIRAGNMSFHGKCNVNNQLLPRLWTVVFDIVVKDNEWIQLTIITQVACLRRIDVGNRTFGRGRSVNVGSKYGRRRWNFPRQTQEIDHYMSSSSQRRSDDVRMHKMSGFISPDCVCACRREVGATSMKIQNVLK